MNVKYSKWLAILAVFALYLGSLLCFQMGAVAAGYEWTVFDSDVSWAKASSGAYARYNTAGPLIAAMASDYNTNHATYGGETYTLTLTMDNTGKAATAANPIFCQNEDPWNEVWTTWREGTAIAAGATQTYSYTFDWSGKGWTDSFNASLSASALSLQFEEPTCDFVVTHAKMTVNRAVEPGGGGGTSETPSEAPSEAPSTSEEPSEAPSASEEPSEAPTGDTPVTEWHANNSNVDGKPSYLWKQQNDGTLRVIQYNDPGFIVGNPGTNVTWNSFIQGHGNLKSSEYIVLTYETKNDVSFGTFTNPSLDTITAFSNFGYTGLTTSDITDFTITSNKIEIRVDGPQTASTGSSNLTLRFKGADMDNTNITADTIMTAKIYRKPAVAFNATVNVSKDGVAADIGDVYAGATGLKLSEDGATFIAMTSSETGVYTAANLPGNKTYTIYLNDGTPVGTVDSSNVTTPAAVEDANAVDLDFYTVALTAGEHVQTVSINGTDIASGSAHVFLSGSKISAGATTALGYVFADWTPTAGGAAVADEQPAKLEVSDTIALTANAVLAPAFSGDTVVAQWQTTGGVNSANGQDPAWIYVYNATAGTDGTTNQTWGTFYNNHNALSANQYMVVTLQGGSFPGATANNSSLTIWGYSLPGSTSDASVTATEASDSTITLRLNALNNKSTNDPRFQIRLNKLSNGVSAANTITATVTIYETSVLPYTAVSLSLQGKIGVNFYLNAEALLGTADVGDAYVQLTHKTDDRVQVTNTLYVKDAPLTADGYRLFTCFATPAQICDLIDIVLYDEGGTEQWSRTGYSIKAYCDAAIAANEDAELVALCKALVRYGDASQTYFGYNAGSVTGDYGTPTASPSIDAKHAITLSDNATGISLKGASLVTRDDTMVRVRYELTSANINNYTITLDKPAGSSMTYQLATGQDGTTYIVITGIESTMLDEQFTLTVTNKTDHTSATLTYSVFTFIKNKLASGSANLQALCRTLYDYGTAADAYFA